MPKTHRRTVTSEEYLGRVARLLPGLAERAEQTEKLRRLPDQTFQEFKEAGLFRALQPERFGGYELDPAAFFEAVIETGTACGSSSWVLGVLGVHSWQIALFSERAQKEVWDKDPDALVSSALAPTGAVEKVKGGFRLSGRWCFSSGCDFCAWNVFAGFVPPEKAGEPPVRTLFLVPRSDYELVDNWHVMGLCGTGSKDLLVKGAFVPEHRALTFDETFEIRSPGLAVHSSPLYRLPLGFIFPNHIASSALGVATGAVRRFLAEGKTRLWAREAARVAEDPFVQARLAEATAAVDTGRLWMKRYMSEMMALASSGTQIPLETRARYRWYTARSVGLSVQAVDLLFEVAGAHAIFLDHPLQRAFRDVRVMRLHPGASQEKIAAIFGRSEFGIPQRDVMF